MTKKDTRRKLRHMEKRCKGSQKRSQQGASKGQRQRMPFRVEGILYPSKIEGAVPLRNDEEFVPFIFIS